MNKSIVILAAILVAVQASHIGLVGHGAPGIVLQGPSSKTALVGPDGSHISSVQAGGTVVAPGHPGGVVAAAVVPGIVAHAAPLALEGQYVHDYSELLYDDGSYKGEYYH